MYTSLYKLFVLIDSEKGVGDAELEIKIVDFGQLASCLTAHENGCDIVVLFGPIFEFFELFEKGIENHLRGFAITFFEEVD